ncbi:MAG: IS1634 family transposase, partial [bacterium]
PRPIVLEYLGKAENLLIRLRQGLGETLKIKSHSHGAVAALLIVARQLDVVAVINRHVHSQRSYWPDKPLRNNLTVGITLLLAAIGRICMPTSKRGWWTWAQTASLEYLLRVSFSKLDSQHFWDLMDCLPEDAIEKIELELLQNLQPHYDLGADTLFYDTTNFYTFVDTENTRCDIAQRARNKQKRHDLRQVGLALVVTRRDFIPLFHHTYKGNMSDSTVFRQVIGRIKRRMQDLNMDLEKHTLVFDRGCNSKQNLALVARLKLHYVGALTPSQHIDLIQDAETNFMPTNVGDKTLSLYRDKRVIWGEERTVLIFISEKLKDGQLRGIYQALKRKKLVLGKIQRSLASPRAKKRTREQLVATIDALLQGQFMKDLLTYELAELSDGHFSMTYRTNKKKLDQLEDKLGFRIIMTDRHEWSSEAIVAALHGQSTVEQAFKNIKNPYHLAVTPEFHWTDQKIRVHYFSCVLGYLLASLIWREARIKADFTGTLDTLLDTLNNIRLTTLLEMSGKRGTPKATRQIEEMTDDQRRLVDGLNLADLHKTQIKIDGVSVYS